MLNVIVVTTSLALASPIDTVETPCNTAGDTHSNDTMLIASDTVTGKVKFLERLIGKLTGKTNVAATKASGSPNMDEALDGESGHNTMLIASDTVTGKVKFLERLIGNLTKKARVS